MKYASVCSGVEAASLAWQPLGWEPAWFAEVEPFPASVLMHRFNATRPLCPLNPNEAEDSADKMMRMQWAKAINEMPEGGAIPNFGDMSKIEVKNEKDGQRFTANGATFFIPGGVDLLVGGTPCQGFSVAGKQGGLRDARSGLAMCYVNLLKAMRPKWFVWENVPGVFSTAGGEDFRAFLREIDAIGYSMSWRVLDAQYTRVDGYAGAVPQRRRRVFVIGHSSGDWRYSASVLFEPDSLHRNNPPSRKTWQEITGHSRSSFDSASAIRERAGKPGGGKGPLVSNQLSLTLATGNDQTLITHTNDTKWRDGGQVAGALTCTSDRQLMPDKERLQCVVENGRLWDESGTNPTLNQVLCRSGIIGASNQELFSQNANGLVMCVHGTQDPIWNTEHANALGRNNGAEQTCQMQCVGKNVAQTLMLGNAGHSYIINTKDTQPVVLDSFLCTSHDGTTPTLKAVDYKEPQAITQALTKAYSSIVLNDQGGAIMKIEKDGCAGTLRANTKGHEQIVCETNEEVAFTLKARDYKDPQIVNQVYENHAQDARVKPIECCQALTARTGTGGGNLPLVQSYAIAENTIGRKPENGGNGMGFQEELAYTQNATGVMGVCAPLDLRNAMRDPEKHDAVNRQGCGIGEIGEPSPTLSLGAVPGVITVGTDLYNSEVTGDVAASVTTNTGTSATHTGPSVICSGIDMYNQSITGDVSKPITHAAADSDHVPCVAGFMGGQGSKAGGIGYKEGVSPTSKTTLSGGNAIPDVVSHHAVRRLTPIECERLMGFPDNWTRIPVKVHQTKPKGKRFETFRDLFIEQPDGTWVEYCGDGPRYKACGNSMCVNVMRWLGMRIELVERKMAK